MEHLPGHTEGRLPWTMVRIALVAALVGFGAGLGCDSGEEDGEDSNVEQSDGYSDEEEDTSTPDPDATEDGGSTNPTKHCGMMTESIGPVGDGDAGQTRGLLGENPEISPDCGESFSEGGSKVYRFEVEESVLFEAEAFGRMGAETDPVLEIHSGSCDDSRTVQSCAQGNRAESILEPGSTYYMWVHGPKPSDKPHFRVEWNAEQPVCLPEEHPKCEGGNYVLCDDPDDREEFACAGDCADETQCTGNTCETAPSVQLGSGAVTLGGDRYAYTGDWSAEGKNNCKGSTIQTSGVEMFAKLEGISSGDTVVFDSSLSGGGEEGDPTESDKGDSNIAFFVLDGCSAEQCLKVGRYDSDGNNRVEWTAESGGPFWVVAEVLGSRDKRKAFEFDVALK